jgi:hypothetical protein
MLKIYGTSAVLLLLSVSGIVAQTTVFANGEDGYLCYRIPAIVKAPNGDLLAFCEARKQSCADHGKTWAITPSVSYPGSNESTAAELANGGILMNMRNQSGDSPNRIMAISNNAGAHWDTVYTEPQLPDPVCQGSMLHFTTAKGQRILLFSNLNHPARRENLTLYASYDDGKTWRVHRVICAGSAAYSDLVIQQNNQVGILYEKDNYTKIVYEREVMSEE